MPKLNEPAPPRTWTCPFCQQTVRVAEDGKLQDDSFCDQCLLQEHIVDGQCVAFRDRRRALDLLLDVD